MDERIEASTAAKSSRSENTQRNVKQADRAFCKFLRQAQHEDQDKRSTLMRNLCDEDKAAVKTSTSALFTFLLDGKAQQRPRATFAGVCAQALRFDQVQVSAHGDAESQDARP